MLIVALLSLLVGTQGLTDKALGDMITDLPDLPAEAKFRMFSGYINVAPSRSIFYWFVESQGNPDTDPVVLWSNGGPGCSGLGGFLTEQGPFRVNNETKLFMNDYSWSKFANMVFVEQPAGVGFSRAPADTLYGDKMASVDNYNFIVEFFKVFPEHATKDFFISSESYGGHYMPTLAKQLVDGGGVPNFRGFAVGNPLTYMPYRNYGQYGTLAGHQLFPQPLVDKYMLAGCDKDDSSDACMQIEGQMDDLTGNLDPYAIDFPICTAEADSAGRNERIALLSKIGKLPRNLKADGSYFPNYDPCRDVYSVNYLNRADVQKAIHADAKVWADCNNAINANYNISDVNAPMMSYYKYLVQTKKLNILVYSGDNDAVCATLGSQQWIWGLGLAVKSEWAPWLVDDQLAGMHVEFDGMHFATVHGAGHMVPATRPAHALELFKNFLSGKW